MADYIYLTSANWTNPEETNLGVTYGIGPGTWLVVDTLIYGYAALGSGDATQDHSEITITTMGRLLGQNAGYACFGSGDTIRNNGYIYGDIFGIGEYVLFGQTTGVFSSVVNTGIIESGSDDSSRAIFTNGEAGESSSVYNTGTIISGAGEDGTAIQYGGNTFDRIVNAGLIIGGIDLGDANDYYDGRRGRIDGVIHGGAGDDWIRGGSDDDVIYGDAGTDTLDGGGGNDRYILADNTTDIVKDTGGGDDTVSTSIGRRLSDFKGIENLTLISFGSGNLTGNSGNNTLIGSYGANTIAGGAGDDVINASKGNDLLLGGSGDDILTGGEGGDIMTGDTGDTGDDTFTFLFVNYSAPITGKGDTITDWSSGDAIDTKFAGTAANYSEAAVASGVDTLEEAAAIVKATVTNKDIANVFLYNSAKDIGFLFMDIDNNDVFETGVILQHAGKASAFSYADLI